MRSFTTTPFCFASLRRASEYDWLKDGGPVRSFYFLVRLREGADLERARRGIEAAVPEVEVHTREEISWRTRRYWLIETGVGLGFRAAAFREATIRKRSLLP